MHISAEIEFGYGFKRVTFMMDKKSSIRHHVITHSSFTTRVNNSTSLKQRTRSNILGYINRVTYAQRKGGNV